MHINLLNYDNIEGKGLSVLLGNEGHQVDLISRKEKTVQQLPTDKSSSLLLINIEILSATNPAKLLKRLNRYHTILLLGKLQQLHWLNRFTTKRKGFICKESTFTELLALLTGIKECPILLDDYVQLFLQRPPLQRQSQLLQHKLSKPISKTELIMMHEISQGKTTKQIAKDKYLSIHTIYNHRKNIKQKFVSAKHLKLSKFCMLYQEAIQTLILIEQGKIK